MKQLIVDLEHDIINVEEIYKIVKINKNLNMEFPRKKFDTRLISQLNKIYIENEYLVIEKGTFFIKKMKIKLDKIQYIWVNPISPISPISYRRYLNFREKSGRNHYAFVTNKYNEDLKSLMSNFIDSKQFKSNENLYNNADYIDLSEENNIEESEGRLDSNTKVSLILFVIILIFAVIISICNFLF